MGNRQGNFASVRERSGLSKNSEKNQETANQ